MKRRSSALLAMFLLLFQSGIFAQVLFNEICPSNVSTVADNNGKFDDWIELYNTGSVSVNLKGYGISDDSTNHFKLICPSFNLDAGKYMLVFASGHDQTAIADHWEIAVNASTTWKYFVGTSQPDTNWRNRSFNDGTWTSGGGGIGYGYANEVTTITPTPVRSLMMRKTFNVSDSEQIVNAILNIDFDDGFVAFINGVEIARLNVGVIGDRPLYNTLALGSHQARMYLGQAPDSIYVNPVLLKSCLRTGSNVLAVEVHNSTPTSGDILAIPYLAFGVCSGHVNASSFPSWFHVPAREYLHANFKLTHSGETIYLSDPINHSLDLKTFGNMDPDNSTGRKPDGSGSWCVFSKPTPDSTNNASVCYAGYATIPLFSLNTGFYISTQTLSLTTGMPGGVIRYTTDGSIPTTSSHVYSGTISLDSTQTVRAAVFVSGYLPSPVISNTYFINEDVHLPIFSLNTDPANLWSDSAGIYVLGPNASPNFPYFGANYWQDWLKPVSIEYYTKAKDRAFRFNAQFRIGGSYSRTHPQKSFEIVLSGQYGTSTLNYPLIPDKSYLSNWNDIILRNAGTDWMNVHYRDDVQERLLKTTDVDYNASEPCVVYLNGKFWGVYQIRENSDDHFVEANYGYTKDQIDYLEEKGPLTVHKGSDTAFYSMYNYAKTANHATTSFYNTMGQYWDLKNFTDNFVAETYYCNEDWIGPWTNNIKMWRPIAAGGKWKYIMNDLDFGLGLFSHYQDNMLDTALHPQVANYETDLLTYMLENPTYKNYFINRYADLVNTIFIPANVNSVINQYHDSTAFDMNQQFNVYGGTPGSWAYHISIAEDFANNRPQYARDYIQGEFSMTSQVTLTLNVQPAGAGRIQISTVSPSSYPWSGVYFNGNPVTITAIPNPGYTFNHWRSIVAIPSNNSNQSLNLNFTDSDHVTAYFTGSSSSAHLVVSEFNYHSDSIYDSGDWIELHNVSNQSLNISNWSIRDEMDNHRYRIPVGTVIPARGYLVVATDMLKFATQHPSVTNVIGPMGFDLSNAGEEIRIFDYNDSLYVSFIYQDTPPWPVEADGLGYTCELLDSLGNLNDGTNWFAGCLGGSPGRAYSNVLGNHLSVTGNTSFCTGQSAMLTVSSAVGYTYQWQRNHINISGATNQTYNVTTAGNYTVRYSYQGCSALTDSVHMTVVSQGPNPVISTGYHCGPGQLTLVASSSDTVYWYDAPAGNLIHVGDTLVTPVLNSTTNYFAQTSLNCPSNLVTATASILDTAALPVASNVTRCGPGTAQLIATDTAAIRWYNQNGALLASNDTFLTPTVYVDTIFYVEAGNYCPSPRIAVTVFVNSAVTPTTTDSSRCGSGTLVLTASSPDPVFWYDSPVGGNLVGAGSVFTTPILDTITVYYAEANNGCASPRVLVTAFVNPIPPPPTVSDTSVCGPVSAALTASSLEQIFWYDSLSGGNMLASSTVFNTPVISSNTIYYVECGYTCRSQRVAVNVMVNPTHSQPIVTGDALCGSGTFTLHASSPDTVFWYDLPTGGTLLATDSIYTTPVLTSSQTYYAVAGSLCPSAPVAVPATVYPLPVVNLGPDTIAIFSGQILTLNAGSGFSSYLWSTGSHAQTIHAGVANTYSVTITDSNGCTGTDQVVITIISSVQELSSGESFRVYPNPAKDHITVEVQSDEKQTTNLQVLDLEGRILQQQDIKLDRGLNTLPVFLDRYPKGMYFIRIITNQKVRTARVTIQ